VDAFVEVVADDLLCDGAELVAQRNHVVAVPADAAADVQQHFVEVHQCAGDLVGDHFGRVEVARVEAEQFAVLERVAHVELMRTDRAALGADAEEFAFDGVAVVTRVAFDGEDLVQRIGQAFARGEPVERGVFEAVRNPEVGDAAVAQFLAERFGDGAAGDAVLDPELPHARVGAGERQSVLHHRVREVGGVEVEADAVLFRPVDPAFEVLHFQFIALDLPAVGLGVDRVQVEPLLAGDEREHFVNICAQFFGVAGAARVVAGHSQSAVEGPGVLEAGDVVALPAVEADRDAIEPLERGFDIDS